MFHAPRGGDWPGLSDIRFRPPLLGLRVRGVVGVRSSFPASKPQVIILHHTTSFPAPKPQFIPPHHPKFFSGPKIVFYHLTYYHRKSPKDPLSLRWPPLEKGSFFRPQNSVNALSDHHRRCTIPSCQSIHGPKVP